MDARKIVSMKQQETAILVMTDLHYGKKTSTFSPDVFPRRLDAVSERLARIRTLLGNEYDIDKLIICMLGDVNDGTGIYKTQAHHQAISNVEQQADELSNYLVDFSLKQQDVWSKVEIEAIPGNHGRSGSFVHEAANWDMVTYRYLDLKLRDRLRVDWNRHTDPFIRRIDVRGHPILMYHGHGIKSYAGIPWYGMNERMSKWSSTVLAPFELVLMGHFHTLGSWKINRINALFSGTMVSGDDWALQIGYESSNQWWLFGVSDKRVLTWQFAVDLDD